jgi:hypothetical protein
MNSQVDKDNQVLINETPNKQIVRDQSHESLLADEFEEEAIEIDCGVIDPS